MNPSSPTPWETDSSNGRPPTVPEIEIANLRRCEAVIQQSENGRIDELYRKALALCLIHDGKWYQKQNCKSFDAYVEERWSYCRTHAYRLVEIGALIKTLFPSWRAALSPFGDTAMFPFGDTSSPFGDTATSPFGDTATSPFGDTATSPFGDTATSPFGDTASVPFGDILKFLSSEGHFRPLITLRQHEIEQTFTLLRKFVGLAECPGISPGMVDTAARMIAEMKEARQANDAVSQTRRAVSAIFKQALLDHPFQTEPKVHQTVAALLDKIEAMTDNLRQIETWNPALPAGFLPKAAARRRRRQGAGETDERIVPQFEELGRPLRMRVPAVFNVCPGFILFHEGLDIEETFLEMVLAVMEKAYYHEFVIQIRPDGQAMRLFDRLKSLPNVQFTNPS